MIDNFYLLKTAKTLIEEASERVHDVLVSRGGYLRKGPGNLAGSRFTGGHIGNAHGSIHRNVHKSRLMDGVKVLKFRNEDAYVYGDT